MDPAFPAPVKRAAVTALLAASALACGRPEARAADGEPPVFTRQPQPASVPFGHTAVLAADTEFEPSLRWEWRKNGTVISGAATSRLTVFNAGDEDTAEYHAVALSDAGARWSSPAALIVMPPETAAGRVDETFTDPGFSGPVAALVERADGSLIAGGEFFSARGLTNTTRLARLLPGGWPDTAFRPEAPGPDAAVLALVAAPVPGNAVWVGGAFKTFDTAPAPGLVRLTAAGARDPAFVPELPAGVEDVRVLVPLPDGRLYVGGRSRQSSTVSDWLVRLAADGSRDNTFIPPAFLNGRLRAAVLRPDGRLWLGGNFFRPAGSATTYNRLALIEPNGSMAPAFQPPAGAGSGANLEVRCLQLLPDGSVVAGGVFSKVDNFPRFGLARVLANGTVDPAFAPPVPDDAVLALARDAQNRIYAGGDFSMAGTTPVRSILRLSADGVPDPDWQPPMSNGPVQALAMTASGLVTGGSFSLPRQACARLALEPRARPPAGSPVSLPLPEPARLFRRTQILGTYPGPAAVPDNAAATFPVSVAAPGLIEEIRVWLDLRHRNVQTLTITLTPPDTTLPLILTDGAQLRHGADFRRTLFSSQSPRPLSQAGPPYTDALRPVADLDALNGQPAAGTWTLRIADNRQDIQTAVLQSWTLEIFLQPAAPAYRDWLGTRPGNSGTFTSFAFGGRYGQEPGTGFKSGPFRLTHHGWPADAPGDFTYQISTDLQSWRTVTPAARQKIITPAGVTFQATLPPPQPASDRAWWRVQSVRAAE
ncbi:MAG: proprotein convertase P-domain-containing protein [Verrucomicrobiota bacterium]